MEIPTIMVLVLAEWLTAKSISFRCNARKSPSSLFLRGSNDRHVHICIEMCNTGLHSY